MSRCVSWVASKNGRCGKKSVSHKEVYGRLVPVCADHAASPLDTGETAAPTRKAMETAYDEAMERAGIPMPASPSAPSEEMRRLVVNVVTDARSAGFARGQGNDDETQNRCEDESVAALLAAISRIQAEKGELAATAQEYLEIIHDLQPKLDVTRDAYERSVAALSEARRDTERLDWLEGDQACIASESVSITRTLVGGLYYIGNRSFATLREAIDAASRMGGTDD